MTVPATDSIDAAVDAALDMTFLASDPVALFMPRFRRPICRSRPSQSRNGISTGARFFAPQNVDKLDQSYRLVTPW